MKIQVVNPNTSLWMTARIASAATEASGGRFEVVTSNPSEGPQAIETAADSLAAGPRVVEEVLAGIDSGCDGHVIACFDDPAVDACRELASGPVLGIAQGGMMAAIPLGIRFGVVTTADAGIPMIEDMARRYGFGNQLSSVRSCDIPVLALEEAGSIDAVELAAHRLIEDGAEVVVLGCAGMAGLAAPFARRLGVPVVDGVAATVGIVAGLVAAGLRTSRKGVYAGPVEDAK